MFIDIILKRLKHGVPFIPMLQWLFAPFSLSFCFFPLRESTGAYDGRSPVRLVNWFQVLRLPALLWRAAKSSPPSCLPQNPVSVCLPLSLLLIPPPYQEIQMPTQQTEWEGKAPELPSDTFAWVPRAVWPQGDVVNATCRCAYQVCPKVSYHHLQWRCPSRVCGRFPWGSDPVAGLTTGFYFHWKMSSHFSTSRLRGSVHNWEGVPEK